VQETKRIALLIDCDNVSHTAIERVLQELAKHGTVNIRHAHGNWNSPSLIPVRPLSMMTTAVDQRVDIAVISVYQNDWHTCYIPALEAAWFRDLASPDSRCAPCDPKSQQ